MTERDDAKRKNSILPRETQLFGSQEPKSRIQITKGSASIQEWQRHPDGIDHGPVTHVPAGDFFVVGGGKEVLLINAGKEPLGYKKLPDSPIR